MKVGFRSLLGLAIDHKSIYLYYLHINCIRKNLIQVTNYIIRHKFIYANITDSMKDFIQRVCLSKIIIFRGNVMKKDMGMTKIWPGMQ